MIKPAPSDGPGFVKEAIDIRERGSALMGVVVLPEDVIPDKKITSLTYAICYIE